MQKPQGGGRFLVQIPGVRGGMVMDEIDTCITQFKVLFHWVGLESSLFKLRMLHDTFMIDSC